MFRVKVSGKYYLTGKLSEIDYYEAEFELNEGRESYARAIIQDSGILDTFLLKSPECKKYKRWQTCQVVSIKEIKDKEIDKEAKEVEELLVEAIELACVPTTYKRFRSDTARKMALTEALEKKKARIEKDKAKQRKAEAA